MATLQHILALKFLGFTLEEIRRCLRRGPKRLEEVLAQQRAMMEEKRRQIDAILQALEETEALLHAGRRDWDAIARVIQVIQMEQKNEWVKKYFDDAQLQKMEELSAASYSEAARQKLAERGGEWTEEDQRRASEQWSYLAAESRRLALAGADPAGEEAQALAKLKSDLLQAFTQGDPDIEAGLKRFWENFHALPADQQPFDASAYSPGDVGAEFLQKAMEVRRGREEGR